VEGALLSKVGAIDCLLLHALHPQSSVNFIFMSVAENNAKEWEAVSVALWYYT